MGAVLSGFLGEWGEKKKKKVEKKNNLKCPRLCWRVSRYGRVHFWI